LLLTTVIGSGIMGERLAGGNEALALLANTLPTGAMLVVLITMLGPISGAHLNPAVTLAFCTGGRIPARDAIAYAIAQLAGAVIGVFLAHLMFELPLLQVSAKVRSGPAQAFSEWMATFGLVATILLTLRVKPSPSRRPSGSISAPHTGSRPPRPSPIRLSPLPARSPIPLPEYGPRMCRCS
jgi:glycerol uptake facilitator-like aquaporin